MLTDSVLIRRLAHEIDARFRGAKVRDVGLLPDGRTAIALWARGTTHLLCIDIFGSPPLITVEDGELPIAAEPGFVRATGAALRGTSLLGVRSRKGDRLLRLMFGTRSRFGVGDEVELYVELVPRFGNIILVKRDMVVAAAKEFSLADNGTRAVEAGMPYQPPPLRERPPLAKDAAPETLDGESALREPLFVYSKNGMVAQPYVVPLAEFSDDTVSRARSLLDVFREYRDTRLGEGARHRNEQRRAALIKRLDDRERKIRDELRRIDAKRHKADARESLRASGEAIYAKLHELQDDVERAEAKERAAELFSEYKKLGASLPHLDARQALLDAQLEAIDALHWEAERTAEEDVEDVERAVAELEPHKGAALNGSVRKRKRALLEFRTANGSRILVGRSPIENADLTFRVARPNDLWFHAQNIPGAHVILQRDDRDEPSEDDVLMAAALAAYYSKGRSSAYVPVDYTQRKHVRKQKDAPPGLVWYTDFKTYRAEPKAP